MYLVCNITHMFTCFYLQRFCLFCLVFVSSDTLWELAAEEARGQGAGGGQEAGGEADSERSVFLIGSKAGVCSPYTTHLRLSNVVIKHCY